MSQLLQHIQAWFSGSFDPWIVLGLTGQALFTMRFLYQWLHSERAKQSIVPEAFWYFSLTGSLLVLIYAIHKLDPVFILGQAGIIVYIRNIQLIWRKKRQDQAAKTGG